MDFRSEAEWWHKTFGRRTMTPEQARESLVDLLREAFNAGLDRAAEECDECREAIHAAKQ